MDQTPICQWFRHFDCSVLYSENPNMKPIANPPRFVRQAQENTKKKAFSHAKRRAAETLGIHSKTHGPVPSIELFQKESGPSSHAVRSKLTRLGLDFIAHSVPDDLPLKHELLIQAGGKDELPFLLDHTSGVKLYGSQPIVAYLERIYGIPAQSLVTRITKGIDTRIRSRAEAIAWRVREPLLRAQEFGAEVQSAVATLQGTIDYLLERIQAAAKRRA